MSESKQCLSTHGAVGFAPGTYVNEKGEIICGACGEVIGTEKKNLYPTSKLPEWIPKKVKTDG